MARKYAEVAHQVKTRGGIAGNEAKDEVLAFEEHGASAVFPDRLERELEAAIAALFQAVLGRRRSVDVTAKSLELAAVATVDALLGEEADATDLCDRLIGRRCIRGSLWRCWLRNNEAESGLARTLARDSNTLRSSGVAGREAGLFLLQRVRVSVGSVS